VSRPESKTVEGRLADLIAQGGAQLSLKPPGEPSYTFSEFDRRAIVEALRTVAVAKSEIKIELDAMTARATMGTLQ